MADWSHLGELLTGNQADLAYEKGRYQSAQTESALAQAEERRSKAIALEALPAQLKALPGMTPELAAASGGALAAGGGIGDAIDLLLGNQELGFRADLANPDLDSNTQFYRGQGVQGRVLPRYEFGPGGEMMSDLTRPAEKPVVTATGEAQIAADEALARERDRSPSSTNSTATLLGLDPADFNTLVQRSRILAEAKGEGGETGKGKGRAAAALPEARATLTRMDTSFDRTDRALAKLETDPDLWKGVGLTQKIGEIPGNEGDRIRAEFDAIASQLSILALQDIRSGAKTGGAVGQVTENEWPRLADQFGAWSRDMTVGDFRNAAAAIRRELTTTRQSIHSAFDQQYANVNAPAGGSAAAPTGSSGAPPSPKTQAEYDALAPGTVYIDTDGVKKRKKGAQ